MRERDPVVGFGCDIGLALTLGVILLVVFVVVVFLVADPMASPGDAQASAPASAAAGVLDGGDPRSEGQGPGLVGSPLLILAAVVALGLATAAITVLAVRLTQRR